MTVGTSARAGRAITPYEEHRDYVLSVLARRCGWLDPSDRESLLHEAYAVFLQKERDGQLDVAAMRPPQVRAYLTQTALNKAMDEGKRAGRRRSVSLDDDDLGIEPADPGRGLEEQLASRFDDARVREIVAQLPERQQLVIKLRFFFNRTPQEIQRYMGITERVYRRELERATRQLAERFELVRNGTFCDSRRSLILAYVTGVAGPNRRLDARRHLESCPACASWVLELRATTHRAAAIVPAPLLALPLHRWVASRVGLLAYGARRRVTELVTGARSHGLQALARPDPSRMAAFSNIRPSAVAMMLTGCLAAGSTATYCVVRGLPAPLRSLIGASATPHARRHHGRRKIDHAARRTPTAAIEPRALVPASVADGTLPVRSPQAAPGSVVGRRAQHGPRTSTHAAAPGAAARRLRVQAGRVNKATNPEFGLGGGTVAAASSAAPSAAASAAAPGGGSTTSSADSGGGPPPPNRTKPLPEFDP
jgi:RNA polymerase sigma factor (sigma-70 family)